MVAIEELLARESRERLARREPGMSEAGEVAMALIEEAPPGGAP